jgi:hypothetical protein
MHCPRFIPRTLRIWSGTILPRPLITTERGQNVVSKFRRSFFEIKKMIRPCRVFGFLARSKGELARNQWWKPVWNSVLMLCHCPTLHFSTLSLLQDLHVNFWTQSIAAPTVLLLTYSSLITTSVKSTLNKVMSSWFWNYNMGFLMTVVRKLTKFERKEVLYPRLPGVTVENYE